MALSIEELNNTDNAYLYATAKRMSNCRDRLVRVLAESQYDIDLWIPKGGYFILADISRCKVDEKYLTDEHGQKRTHDQAFAYQLCSEQRVVCIPMTSFYEEDEPMRDRYVRFAFCKEE